MQLTKVLKDESGRSDEAVVALRPDSPAPAAALAHSASQIVLVF